MHRKLLLLTFVLTLTINGQVKSQSVITPSVPDTLLISEVEEKNQLTYIKGSENTYTGTIVDYYENGQLRLRKSVIDGKAEGIWLEWYETGIPRFIAEWKLGRGHGVWMYFHENGQLRVRETVDEDIWHGISESWFENGKKRSEGYNEKGRKHGTWKEWNQDGSISSIEIYSHGQLIEKLN